MEVMSYCAEEIIDRSIDYVPPDRGLDKVAAEKKILAAGGRVAISKTAIDKLAWQGYFFDTERNMFGLHQTFQLEK